MDSFSRTALHVQSIDDVLEELIQCVISLTDHEDRRIVRS